MNVWAIWTVLLKRETLLLVRNRYNIILAALFFIQVAGLFPLGINPEPEQLRLIGQAVIPVCALLSSILLFHLFFEEDFQDGSLIDLLLLPVPPLVFVSAKIVVHAALSGLLLAVIAPVMAVLYQFDLAVAGRAALAMLLLAPVLSSLGALSAALTLGVRNAHILPALIYLPLSVPALIFAMLAISRNQPADWYLLAAITVAAVFFLPLGATAAIKWAIS